MARGSIGPFFLSACGLMVGLAACTSVKPVDLTLLSQTNVKTVNTGLVGDRVLKPTKTFNIVAFYNGNERIEAWAPYTDSEGQPLEECVGYSAQLRKGTFGRHRVLKLTRLVPATNAVPASAIAPAPRTLAEATVALETSAATTSKPGVTKTAVVPKRQKGAATTALAPKRKSAVGMATSARPSRGSAKAAVVSSATRGATRTAVTPKTKRGVARTATPQASRKSVAKATVARAPETAAPVTQIRKASAKPVNRATTARERAL